MRKQAEHAANHSGLMPANLTTLAHFYLARLQTTSADVPNAVVGFVYFSSSAVSEAMVRFCSTPTKLGNELPSTRVVRVLSASLMEYVPKWAINPFSTALF